MAQEPDLASRLSAVEKTVDRQQRRLHVPGAALVIVRDDQVVYLKGLGYRSLKRLEPVTPDTLFAIGSCTKAFTSMTALMAADEGRLALSDPPRKYLLNFKLRDPEVDAKITISDLLSHRSGLDRTELIWITGVLSPREVLRAVTQAKPSAKLGEKFQYQNVMFLAAGEIVAKVERRPWRQVVARRIFKPLGMRASNTSVRAMQEAPDFSFGYNYDEETKETTRLPMRDLRNIAPAGAINSSARDMARWLRFVLAGGTFEGKRLISPEKFGEWWVKRIGMGGTSGYGYGWMLREWRGHKIMEHGGNIDGFNAHVAVMPDQKLGVVLLTNVSASALPQVATQAVWENLVRGATDESETATRRDGETANAGPEPSTEPRASSIQPAATEAVLASGEAVDPAAEAGTYRLEAAKLDVAVRFKEGKLTAQPTAQPELPLENVSGRRYQIGPPAPPGFFMTFRPAKEDPKETEIFVEQGEGGPRYVLTKVKEAAFTAPIGVEELMRKVIDAAGGEPNLRRHRSLVTRFTLEMDSQGVTGKGVRYARAPNALTEEAALYAAGKKIATMRDTFDGKQGATETSFTGRQAKKGKSLVDAALEADFAPELNWKTLFKSVSITKIEKVGDEEAYVVRKAPAAGNPVTDYFSTKTFRLLKRDTLVSLPALGPEATVPLTETFSDYREVDGVLLPFKHVRLAPTTGEIVMRVTEVRWDARLRNGLFRPTGECAK